MFHAAQAYLATQKAQPTTTAQTTGKVMVQTPTVAKTIVPPAVTTSKAPTPATLPATVNQSVSPKPSAISTPPAVTSTVQLVSGPSYVTPQSVQQQGVVQGTHANATNNLAMAETTAQSWAKQQGKAMVVLQVKTGPNGIAAPASQGLGPVDSYAVTGFDWNSNPPMMNAQYYKQVAGPFLP
jgi:hypothetical protein